MKNLLMTVLIMFSLTATAFATDEKKISLSTRETFNQEFNGAENVEWTVKRDFVKATCTLKGERLDVFYDLKGTKIGSSHYIALEDLPLSARRMIAKKYAGYNITEAVEFNGAEEDAFFLSAENGKEKVIIKIADHSSLSVYKKSRKDTFW